MKTITRILMTSVIAVTVSACNSGLFDKDNTPRPSPLVSFQPEANAQTKWSTRVNTGSKDYLRLNPVIDGNKIFTSDVHGHISATDKNTGRTIWKTYTGIFLSSGPGVRDNIVVAGSREGDVVGLNQTDGSILWKSQASSEILASPGVANNETLIKSIDGKISAFSNSDGHVLWHYQQPEPTLILHGASAPTIQGDTAVIGFANGNLIKLSLDRGSLIWQKTISIPQGSFLIERMVDIDADPIILDRKIYAATYQGHIVALDYNSGREIWNHDLSSYTGMAVDYDKVYVTDAKGHVWAFDAHTGSVLWRQTQLEARNTTRPVIVGNFIVVGDAQGYVHWLSKQDGHFMTRVRVNSSGIFAAPVVSDNVVYVLAQDGTLSAYTVY